MATERILAEIPGADGRMVDVLVAGPEEGLPLVFHNGTPGGLVPFEQLTAAASVRGLRVVTAVRPELAEITDIDDPAAIYDPRREIDVTVRDPERGQLNRQRFQRPPGTRRGRPRPC